MRALLKRPGFWIVVLLSGGLVVLVGIRFISILTGHAPKASTGKHSMSAGAAPPVGVANVTRRVLQYEFQQVGSVESGQTVNITAKTVGPITALSVRQGDAVRVGQVLVRIDPSPAQAALYKSKSDLATARYNYYQQEAQIGLTGVQAVSAVDIAHADLLSSQAGIQKSQSVYNATYALDVAAISESRAKLVAAQAAERQAESAYAKSKATYDRTLGLENQGFASNADVQDAYQDVVAQYAAVNGARANVVAAAKTVDSSRSQSAKDNVSDRADILTARFLAAQKQATLAEARAGTAKTSAFKQQLLALQSQVDSAQASARTAQLQLQDTVLTSPVNGFVIARLLDLGAVASVGSVILTVQAGNQLWVVSALPQEIYGRVKAGQTCKVTVDGVRNRVFVARVAAIDPAIDAASRQFNIRMLVSDPKHQIKPGMFARVTINVGRKDPRPCIPNGALNNKDDDQRTATVYKVVNDKVQSVLVKLGPSDSLYTVVKQGLAVGDTVVVQTLGNLKDGQTVSPQTAVLPTVPGTNITDSATPAPSGH
jgi:RND family efflux transporter MFP subunit